MTKNTMRIIGILLAIVLIIATFSQLFLAVANAEEVEKPLLTNESPKEIVADGKIALEFLKEFQKNYFDRTSGTEKEKQAAVFIGETFEKIGLSKKGESYLQEFSMYEEDLNQKGKLIYSQNVVGVQKSSSNNGKKVIISAHYDNEYATTSDTAPEGAAYATGVAALIEVATILSQYTFDFDIEYVAFGMYEKGYLGSKAYIEKATTIEMENTLLMVSLDAIALGDFLYIYTDEEKRIQQDNFMAVSDASAYITPMPDNKRSTVNIGGTKPFYHAGHASDANAFLNLGVPTVTLFGGNLTSKDGLGYTEREGAVGILGTSNDNFNHLLNSYGEKFIVDRLKATANTVSSVLRQENFVADMEKSRAIGKVDSIFYNKYFYYGVGLGVLVIFIIILTFVNKKLSQEKRPEIPTATITPEEIFQAVERAKQEKYGQNQNKPKDNKCFK